MEKDEFLNIKKQHLLTIKANIETLTEQLCTASEDEKKIIHQLLRYNKAYESVGGINLDYIDTEWYEVIINLKPYDMLLTVETKTLNIKYENLIESFEKLIQEYNFEKKS